MEYVDILTPPLFQKSGQTKLRKQALQDGDWIGAFNLWIIQTNPIPAIVYQQRSPNSTWEPNKLDVSAGGNYAAGESLLDGLREAEEELGKKYDPTVVNNIGRRLNVSPDKNGLERKTVLDIFLVEDNSSLESYQLEEREVSAITACPVDALLSLHRGKITGFEVELLDHSGHKSHYQVTPDSFPANWDNYHYKMALLVERYLSGERGILY